MNVSNTLQTSTVTTVTTTNEYIKKTETLNVIGHRNLIDFVDKRHVTCKNVKRASDVAYLFPINDKKKDEKKEIIFKKEDLICRRASSEGYYYYGEIEKIINNKYTIKYGDGERDKNVKRKFIHEKIRLHTNDEIEAQLVDGQTKYYKCKVQQSNEDGTNTVIYQQEFHTIHLLYIRISIEIATNKENNRVQESKDSKVDKKGTSYLESDCDEQLLLSIPLVRPIKLHSICFIVEAPLNGATDPRSLRTVLLFINKPFLDFDEAEDLEHQAIANITLNSHQLAYSKSSIISLPYSKLQNVSHLTLFIKNNQGDAETTVLSRVIMFGQPAGYINMKKHKRDTEHHFSGLTMTGGWNKAPGCD